MNVLSPAATKADLQGLFDAAGHCERLGSGLDISLQFVGPEDLRIFNSGFGPLASGPDLYPEALRADINSLNDAIYATFNNGVYRAGFATTQLAYDEAFADVFATLDALELRLSDGRAYLHGSTFTETDIRAFVTLARFDAAYHGLFKCNLRQLADYPQLSAYLARVYRLPGIADTVSIDHIKRGYY